MHQKNVYIYENTFVGQILNWYTYCGQNPTLAPPSVQGGGQQRGKQRPRDLHLPGLRLPFVGPDRGDKTADGDGVAGSPGYAAGTVATEYEYDNLGRLVAQYTPFEESGSSVHYAAAKYYYDPAGNLTRERARANAPGGQEAWSRTDYAYNSRNLLTDAYGYEGPALAYCSLSFITNGNQPYRQSTHLDW